MDSVLGDEAHTATALPRFAELTSLDSARDALSDSRRTESAPAAADTPA
jgi:hypothetical protein